jgi:hypothetical protein
MLRSVDPRLNIATWSTRVFREQRFGLVPEWDRRMADCVGSSAIATDV